MRWIPAPLRPPAHSPGFQTDTDISRAARGGERELKPWVPDAPTPDAGGPNGASNGGERDTITFGGPVSNVPWDQFETNERLFGAKTDYDEELYTTKLDRSSAGYKKREHDADKLAREILSVREMAPKTFLSICFVLTRRRNLPATRTWQRSATRLLWTPRTRRTSTLA